jgi:hypothetical protein
MVLTYFTDAQGAKVKEACHLMHTVSPGSYQAADVLPVRQARARGAEARDRAGATRGADPADSPEAVMQARAPGAAAPSVAPPAAPDTEQPCMSQPPGLDAGRRWRALRPDPAGAAPAAPEDAAARERRSQAAERRGREAEALRRAIAEREARNRALFARRDARLANLSSGTPHLF